MGLCFVGELKNKIVDLETKLISIVFYIITKNSKKKN